MPAKKTVKAAKQETGQGFPFKGCNATWGWIILILGVFLFFQELFAWPTNVSAWALVFILFGIWLVKVNQYKK